MKTLFIPLLFLLLILFALPRCSAGEPPDYARLRKAMVREQIAGRGVTDPRILSAMGRVPRHLFVPVENRPFAYGDRPLPIGKGQTISQPYIVAFMTEALGLRPGDKVLEIGTGSGYQAAILAELGAEVYTVEIIEALGKQAAKILGALGYKNVHPRIGDGYGGWPGEAPFDAIMVTCAPEKIPHALIEQLNEGGRIIIPVGRKGSVQKLVRGLKQGGRIKTEDLLPVRFVPMVRGADREIAPLGPKQGPKTGR